VRRDIRGKTGDTVRVDVASIIGVRVGPEPSVDDGGRSVGLNGVLLLLDVAVILRADVSHRPGGPWVHKLDVVFVENFLVDHSRVFALLAILTLKHAQLHRE
jgi:hypothetical protein